MADDKDEEGSEAIPDELEVALESQIAASSLGPLGQRVEGVAQILVDHKDLEKLTNLPSEARAVDHGMLHGLLALVDAVAEEDKQGFQMPDLRKALLEPEYKLRTSVKQQTRKILESITKIFERGGEQHQSRWGFGRR